MINKIIHSSYDVLMSEYIDMSLKHLLLNNLSFKIKNKTIKEGKLFNYEIKNYFIVMILEKNNKKNNFYIPIPFKIERHIEDQLIYFDYRLCTLCYNNKIMENDIIHILYNKTPSKFYNNIMEIEIMTDTGTIKEFEHHSR